MPLEGTLDDELQMLRSLQDLGSVPSLACDSLVEGAIVLTPILQPLTLAAIWSDCLHLAVPALVSTFQVCVDKVCCSVEPLFRHATGAAKEFAKKFKTLCDALHLLSYRRRTSVASSTEMSASTT